MKKPKLSDPLFTVLLRDDGIVHVQIAAKEEIDIDTARMIIQAIGEKCEGKMRPVLLSSKYFAAPTAEARAFMAEKSSNPFSLASAYIARSLPEKLMANAYIRMNKPARPTRMFTTENKAIEWLKSFL